MDLSRQEYPALLASLQPEQAVNILNDRVYVINKVNSDIADWLQERRKVEETYAAGLRKLSRRPQQDGAASLGIFQMPWQRIVSGTENLAQSHETLAAKIESDVETPLRQFQSKNKEMQGLTSTQGNLASIAKDLGNAQKKDQTKSKTQHKLEEASREWESQAPYVFEQLQALDETRVNHLRDVLTQFQTHETDQVERNRSSAESSLNALLNIETADEIKTFAARVTSGRASIPRRPSAATTSTAGRPVSSMGPPPTPPPPRLTRDVSSQSRFGSNAGQDTLTPLPEKKSSIGGLKRLGTVMRRKDKAPPPVPSSSEKRKEKGRSLIPFRRGESSRSFQDLEASGQDFSPISSRSEDPRYRQSMVQRIPTQQTDVSQPAEPVINGTHEAYSPETPAREQMPIQSEPFPPQNQFAPPQELSAMPASPETSFSDAITRAQQEASSTQPDEPARNLTIRDKPIQEDETEAQQALTSVANQLRMQSQSPGFARAQGSVRGRRDVRNTMFMPSPPVLETSDSAATPSNTSTIPAAALATTAAVGVGGAALASDGVSDLASPIKQAPPSAPILEERPTLGSNASDATSIHSAHSLAGALQHPELSTPGLNASIIETVNTWFDANGTISKSFAVGEVALAYNPDSSSDAEPLPIRLSSFQVLEKVAANPIFLNSSPASDDEAKAGQYTVLLSSIRRPQPTVALKYQLHLDPANLSLYAPLIIAPAWQCQEGQASVIIAYGLNPAFQGLLDDVSREGGDGTLVTLRNVVVSVALDQSPTTTGEDAAAPAPKAISAMMKPLENASFRRKAGAVVWRLGEIRLSAADVMNPADADAGPVASERKLLVRFMTGSGVPRRGSVDVKFELVGRAGSRLGVSVLRGAGAKGEKERDPFADEERGSEEDGGGGEDGIGGWEEVNTVRGLVAGKYCAA